MGPEPALELVEALDLDTYYLWHALRGDLLQRLGRGAEAADAFARAPSNSRTIPAERDLLTERLDVPRTGA